MPAILIPLSYHYMLCFTDEHYLGKFSSNHITTILRIDNTIECGHVIDGPFLFNFDIIGLYFDEI